MITNRYTLRRTEVNAIDAAMLREVEQRSMGDSDYSVDEVLALLRRPEQYAYLAVSGDESAAVGFVSCIETPTGNGVTRLEIDMLGVVPEHRRRGLALALVTRAMDDAVQRGVRRFRGIVAVDNDASRRVFRRAGFAESPDLYQLVTYDVLGLSPVPFLPWRWSLYTLTEGGGTSPAGGAPFRATGPGREVHQLQAAGGATVALA
ncbi:MAG TPA: GNAT family N-acetyltransferase, partial [Chloroflexi bacterium]|nr:GNAT family N-acetyltransferase [Chloroflexota bacterium]